MSMPSEQSGPAGGNETARSDQPPSDSAFGPTFAGRYGDGQSATTTDVEVRLTETGIEITRTAPREILFWPYGGLTTGAPLGPHATDALLAYRYVPDATLFVTEGGFARRLRELAPHLTTSAARWGHARPWLWAAAALLLAAAGIWAVDLSPARGIARLIPDGTRVALGGRVVGSMTTGRKVCDVSDGRAALDKLVVRLSDAARGPKPFKVTVVDWNLVNAFAAPGEQIVLTRGLIEKSRSADEVAGVLAHEMGHGIEMHPEAGIVRALGLAAATDLVFGGSGGAMGNIGVLLAQLSYTRSAEREADQHAIRILREASISPQGLADFFARVSPQPSGEKDRPQASGDKADRAPPREPAKPRTGGSFDILSTHPQSAERARLVASQPRYPSTPAVSASDWAALRAICGPAKRSDGGSP